jgi:hypothetical protein
MLTKYSLIITTFASIAASLQGASSVYAQTFPGFIPSQTPTTYHQKVTHYDHQKNCATDQHTETTVCGAKRCQMSDARSLWLPIKLSGQTVT